MAGSSSQPPRSRAAAGLAEAASAADRRDTCGTIQAALAPHSAVVCVLGMFVVLPNLCFNKTDGGWPFLLSPLHQGKGGRVVGLLKAFPAVTCRGSLQGPAVAVPTR